MLDRTETTRAARLSHGVLATGAHERQKVALDAKVTDMRNCVKCGVLFKGKHGHNRRARKRSSGGVISPGLARKLFKLQSGKCACCGLSLGGDYHMDHIMPIAMGGPNEDRNIQLLRAACNIQKTAKHPVDFMQSRGFLL